MLYAGTDSSRSSSVEFELALKDSRAFIIERTESSLEISKTLKVTLEKIQREENSYSEDGNTPYACGCWSTATDRT
jgi:hypothetical protein